jgi:hypothetical protein
MKIRHWHHRLGAALLAFGLITPSAALAANIPIPDASFESYVVPAAPPQDGYAYAGIVPVRYRPTSPWISRPGAGNFQDGGPSGSNWLYNSSYAESAKATARRPAPRTGDQAMHGRGFISGQVLPQVFEAGATYTFSIYAQGDTDAQLLGQPYGWQSRVFLYIYDGSQFGNNIQGINFELTGEDALTYNPDEYNPLSPSFTYFPHDRFAPPEPDPNNPSQTHPGNFVNRDPAWTAAQSRAAWQKINVSLLVLPDAPEVGKSIGIAFQAFEDGAVDDAALDVLGPGDLNGDLTINAADWTLFRTNQLKDLSSFSTADRYARGDLNGDGKNDGADFALFKTSYEDVHGAGSLTTLLAGVPEPTGVVLAGAAAVPLLMRRRRKKNE